LLTLLQHYSEPSPASNVESCLGAAQAELGRGTHRSATNCTTPRSVAFPAEISKEQAVGEIG
jgi:hypothetical protein